MEHRYCNREECNFISQMVKFELTQAKCDEIDNYKTGDDVTVHFNVRGRKWTNKEGKDVYFVSLNAWRLEAVQAGSGDAPAPTESDIPPMDEGMADDLPF